MRLPAHPSSLAKQRRQGGRPCVALHGLGQPLPCIEAAGAVYADYNGTTPVFPEVANAMLPFMTEQFGNPSSGHIYGLRVSQEDIIMFRDADCSIVPCSAGTL